MTMLESLPGNARLVERMGAVTERADDMTPVLDGFVELFRRVTAQRFANNGPGWVPLAESTIAKKERMGWPVDEILVATGAMLESLLGKGEGGFVEMLPDMVTVGTEIPYAHWHQTGGTRRHASGAEWPPQRKIVDLTEAEVEESALLVANWLFRGATGAAA